MNCEICGGEFRPSGHGKRQKYCSESCRNKSKYRRRKDGTSPQETQTKRNPKPEPLPDLDKREFDRMMDDSIEDVLRASRDRLKKAMEDLSTPANALPAISRQLIAVCDRLRQVEGGGGLFDEDETMKEAEDVGASIV